MHSRCAAGGRRTPHTQKGHVERKRNYPWKKQAGGQFPPSQGQAPANRGSRKRQAGKQSTLTLDEANAKIQEGRPGVPASRRPGVPASRRPDCSHTPTGWCQSPLPNRNVFIVIHGCPLSPGQDPSQSPESRGLFSNSHCLNVNGGGSSKGTSQR